MVAYDFPNNPQIGDRVVIGTQTREWSGVVWSLVPTITTGPSGYTGSHGFVGSQGTVGFTGSRGSQGIQGIQGFSGSQGIQGFAGSIGFTGSFGSTGFNGSVGFVGSRGTAGTDGGDGTNGFTGSQGTAGFTGSVGFNGSIGATGFTGSFGATGFTGSFGATGFIGSKGFDGSRGFNGSVGATGFNGSIGFTGSLGATGFNGSIGFNGSQGPAGNFGGATFDYTFDTATTNADPGVGKLRLNNANVTLATQLYIDDQNDSSTDIQSFLRTIDDSTSTLKGHFRISNKLDASDFAIFTITSIVEETGHFTVNSAYVTGSATAFSNNEDVIITFARTGDIGATGFTGSFGATGFTGSIGFTGSFGNTGFVGSQGVAGPIAGTDGQIIYNNGGVSGGANVYYDDVNQRLGVGTATPSEKLHVDGNIKMEANRYIIGANNSIYLGEDAAAYYVMAGTNVMGTSKPIILGANPPLVLKTNSIEQLRIDTAGNVGIGVTVPTQRLHLKGTIRLEEATSTSTTDISSVTSSLDGQNTTRTRFGNILFGTGDRFRTSTINSSHRLTLTSSNSVGGTAALTFGLDGTQTDVGILYARDGGTLNFINGANSNSDSYTIRATITSTGNFGIGTTSPTQKLDIAGNTTLRNSTTATSLTIHNTYTDASNYERAFLKMESNEFRIGTEALGTGTERKTYITNFYGFLGASLNVNNQSLDNVGAVLHHETNTSANIGVKTRASDASVRSFSITGQQPFATATTNINGGNVVISGGAPVSTGSYGNVILSAAGGNVGIGTTVPTAKTHIVLSGDTPNPVLYVKRNNNAGGGLGNPEIGIQVDIPNTYNGAGIVYGIKVFANHNFGSEHYAGHFEAKGGPYATGIGVYAKTTHTDTNGAGFQQAILADAYSTIGATNSGYAVGVHARTNDYVNNVNLLLESNYTGAAAQTAVRFVRNAAIIGSITTSTVSTSFNTSSTSGITGVDGNTVAFTTNSAERIRITSTGNVGIGTITPVSRLNIVGGGINTGGGSGLGISSDLASGRFAAGPSVASIASSQDASTVEISAGSTGGQSGIAISGSGGDVPTSIRFWTVSERMRIDSSGRLLIGTTTASGANLLQVNSDARISGITVGRGTASIATNTAVGVTALNANTTGNSNTAVGHEALFSNTTGTANTATGLSALRANLGGTANTATGRNALLANTTGIGNTAMGLGALVANTTGSYNTCIGHDSGQALTTGSNNTIIGRATGAAGLADTVIIAAGTTERMRIDSSGNLGIATAVPTQRLDVAGNTTLRNGTTATNLTVHNTYTDASNYEHGKLGWNANVLEIGTVAAGTGTLRNINLIGGNVGIGTSAPAFKLHLYEATANPQIRIQNGSTGAIDITPTSINSGQHLAISASSYVLLASTTNDIIHRAVMSHKFENNSGSEWMRITATGNVGIGTAAPGYKLHVVGSAGYFDSGLRLGGGYSAIDVATGVSGLYLSGSQGALNHLFISSAGNLGVGATTPSAKLDVAGDIEVNSNVNLNSEATTLATTTKTQIASFPAASFRSGKLIVQAYDSVTGQVQISELLVAHNGTTASATEYGVVFTGTTSIVIYDVDISAGNVRLLATRTTANSTQYKISETLMIA